jgi:hypothetical protein
MKEFKVLVEKPYVIGHYARVMAEDAEDARNKVISAIDGADGWQEIEDSFTEVEGEVDDALSLLQDCILNTPSVEDGELRISEQEGWGRPLVMEVDQDQDLLDVLWHTGKMANRLTPTDIEGLSEEKREELCQATQEARTAISELIEEVATAGDGKDWN